MPNARLEKARSLGLPEGYQFGDGRFRVRCSHCGAMGHGWMRCDKLLKAADAFMASMDYSVDPWLR